MQTENDYSCFDMLRWWCDFFKNAVYIPLCVIDMILTRNGSSPPDVCSCFLMIVKNLNEIGYIVNFVATDGDISFDKIH